MSEVNTPKTRCTYRGCKNGYTGCSCNGTKRKCPSCKGSGYTNRMAPAPQKRAVTQPQYISNADGSFVTGADGRKIAISRPVRG